MPLDIDTPLLTIYSKSTTGRVGISNLISTGIVIFKSNGMLNYYCLCLGVGKKRDVVFFSTPV